jgi:hypothetical protein
LDAFPEASVDQRSIAFHWKSGGEWAVPTDQKPAIPVIPIVQNGEDQVLEAEEAVQRGIRRGQKSAEDFGIHFRGVMEKRAVEAVRDLAEEEIHRREKKKEEVEWQWSQRIGSGN